MKIEYGSTDNYGHPVRNFIDSGFFLPELTFLHNYAGMFLSFLTIFSSPKPLIIYGFYGDSDAIENKYTALDSKPNGRLSGECRFNLVR